LDGFEQVSWEIALGALGERLAALRAGGGAHRLAVLDGRGRGLTVELMRRFARAFGTPNVIDASPHAAGPIALANLLMQGVEDEPAYDWNGARYVLSLGSGVLDSSCQTVAFTRAAAGLRRDRARAKVVHVGPVRTRTAVNADEHVRIRPQTYGAFALGLAHVLLRDGLHDAAFVAEHTLGFERWTDADGREHAGLRDVLAGYGPERVAALCGVAASDVERLARESAEFRPGFVIGGADELRGSNGNTSPARPCAPDTVWPPIQ
jgi:anaerobic selenocysteine-containing dehydrogenase